MIHVLTYATHSEGNFDNMINNSYGIEIIVLGWGDKWTGFSDKFKAVYNYTKDLPENDIVLFLDGFDVWVNSDLNRAVNTFFKLNKKIIFSKEQSKTGHYLSKRVFGECRPELVLNTGMYMGYAKYLNILLKEALEKKCKDDQRIMNGLCKRYSFIDIDKEGILFKNILDSSELKKSNACFISMPFTIKFKRTFRSAKEYSQFFIYELTIFIFCLTILLVYFRQYKVAASILMGILLYYLFIDKSCIL